MLHPIAGNVAGSLVSASTLAWELCWDILQKERANRMLASVLSHFLQHPGISKTLAKLQQGPDMLPPFPALPMAKRDFFLSSLF